MNKDDLINILQGDMARLYLARERREFVFNEDITMYPSDVKRVLNLYLSHQISADDLCEWARYIVLNFDVLHHPGDFTDDAVSDFYDDMYTVVQRLSTPFIDGKITEPLVQQYLNELDKYHD